MADEDLRVQCKEAMRIYRFLERQGIRQWEVLRIPGSRCDAGFAPEAVEEGTQLPGYFEESINLDESKLVKTSPISTTMTMTWATGLQDATSQLQSNSIPGATQDVAEHVAEDTVAAKQS